MKRLYNLFSLLMNYKLYRPFILVIIFQAGQIHGQETNTNITAILPEIVVSAAKIEQPAAQVGASVTVISSEDIEKQSGRTVADLLKNVPGITFYEVGGRGGIADVYLRGSKPGDTLVLLDGAPLNDPMMTDESFNFANLNLDNVERIEIIRGPHSALYGSEAMGGVINIITKKGKKDFDFFLDSGAGSFNTFKIGTGAEGRTEYSDFSISVSHEKSDGFSQAYLTNTTQDPEKDGYESTFASGGFGYDLFDNAKIRFTGRYGYTSADIDTGAFQDDDFHKMINDDMTLHGEFLQKPFDWWNYQLDLSYNLANRNESRIPLPSQSELDSWYKGETIQGEIINRFSYKTLDTLTAGLEGQLESGSSHYQDTTYGLYVSDITNVGKTNTAIYLQNQLNLNEFFNNTTGIRADFTSSSGAVLSYQTSVLIPLADIGLSLKGNAGTGFKDPLYISFILLTGQPTLNPK